MISQFISGVSAKFNPFVRAQRMPRLFLSMLPPDSRTSMKISVSQLPRDSAEKGSLSVTFKDGMEMSFNPEKVKIKEVMAEVDRHSRMLARKENLTSG
ncbi:uncharacterized protein PV09_01558 [Verruconis gallopava]|uniref:Large ribosomal subunit protein mL53 n=1 Tax=Verruconis gallopava TaxID=253628 RepID=A0A0D2ALH3_9PEZI|nr:uncharacterized protein PV09_01558 [Verruconis gallopava]KIW07608.1 hypothetical protein PV09_01558 [Verruconis gallopava]